MDFYFKLLSNGNICQDKYHCEFIYDSDDNLIGKAYEFICSNQMVKKITSNDSFLKINIDLFKHSVEITSNKYNSDAIILRVCVFDKNFAKTHMQIVEKGVTYEI